MFLLFCENSDKLSKYILSFGFINFWCYSIHFVLAANPCHHRYTSAFAQGLPAYGSAKGDRRYGETGRRMPL